MRRDITDGSFLYCRRLRLGFNIYRGIGRRRGFHLVGFRLQIDGGNFVMRGFHFRVRHDNQPGLALLFYLGDNETLLIEQVRGNDQGHGGPYFLAFLLIRLFLHDS